MIALNKNSYYSWDEYPVSFCVFSGMVLEWPDFGRGAPESQRVLFRVEGMHHSLFFSMPVTPKFCGVLNPLSTAKDSKVF